MRLRLKEDPKEWIKFNALLMVFLSGITFWLWKKSAINGQMAALLAIFFGITFLVSLVWPAGFRPLYRAAMTFSFVIGQFIGKILLGCFFLAVLTPMGFVMRLMGKDLLHLKPRRDADSYWIMSKTNRNFDRLS